MQSASIVTELGPAPSWLNESYHDIPMRDGYMSNIKTHRPSSGPAGPLIVLAFGGGFLGGDNDQLTGFSRAFVQLFGATVVNINYRLAPEHPFPTSQLDGIDSMKWIAENASDALLHADPSQGFIMGGLSAGATLTAALTRKFQEEKLAHPLTGQWIAIGQMMDDKSCPAKFKQHYLSREQNADGPGLNKAFLDLIYRKTQWDEHHELGNAVNSKAPISDQPKTFIQTDGLDPLRDDGLIYEEMLKEAGVPTRIGLYPGTPHGSIMGARTTAVGIKENVDAVNGVAWLLGKDQVSATEALQALQIKPL